MLEIGIKMLNSDMDARNENTKQPKKYVDAPNN